MPIVFQNPGEIDIRTIKAFGVSVKPLTDSPLGIFGSGLKYALAILLREGCKVWLWRGLDKHEFSLSPTEIRGKVFEFVKMSGPQGSEDLPFNTHTGFHWEPWCAYRELYSNALDEGGSTYQGTYEPKPDQTAFVVSGRPIEEAHAIRNQIFLGTQPFISSPLLDAHQGESEYVYYRGVRVSSLRHKSMFTYNLRKAPGGLTEDRTLKNESDFMYALALLISTTEDEDYLRSALLAGDNTLEGNLPTWWSQSPSATFEKIFTALREEGRAIAITNFANACWKSKHKIMPLPDPMALNRIQQKQLDKAVDFCKRLGYPVNEFPIVVVPQAPDGLMALAENGKIVLTVGCFNQGCKVVAQALIEEFFHLKYKYQDLTRAFQTHLFEQIVTLGERVLDEPL